MVNDLLGIWRYDHFEGCTAGYRCSILVEDRPLLCHGLIPDTNVVFVSGTAGTPSIRGRSDEDDGFRVTVDARVVEVGVVAAAVLVRGPVDEGSLIGGLLRVGFLGLVGRLDPGVF